MIIDIVVVIVLLFSAAVSFWRGLIREVLTIAGIAGGIIAAYVCGPLLVPTMRGWFGVVDGEEPQALFGPLTYEMAADATAYVGILVVVVILLSFISHFISEFVRHIGLGALDRTLGVLFGLARGILLLGVIYLPFSYLLSDEQKTEYLEPTKSYVYLEATSQWLMTYMPGEVEEALKDSAKNAEQADSVRQKLQDMKLLEGGAEKPAEEQGLLPLPEEGVLEDGAAKLQGYSEEQRNEMNRLIEENLQSGDKNGQ